MNFGPCVKVAVHQHQQYWVLSVAGRADYEETDRLKAAMDQTATPVLPATVIDLSELQFADTSFLHWLLEARRAAPLPAGSCSSLAR